MRLGGRKPNTVIAFIDASSDELLMEIGADGSGRPIVSYHLYAPDGTLVADSGGRKSFPEGLTVTGGGEELLFLPVNEDESIRYRIYSGTGTVLACSDGARTQIFATLRMDSPKQVPAHSAAAKT